MLNYLSVCSGIEAASVAWGTLGFHAVGFSEIDKFPCAVLAHHFPQVRNYGDMTQFREWGIEPGSVDVLVGGTPCQSFSIAGLRGGIEDSRGNLALTYCRILQELRPRWFVWENVPGVFTSWSGADPPGDLEQGRERASSETSDFGRFLGAVAELGYGYAWSVRNAQFFGVPQRRRRVFVVGHLGNWRRAAAVLFEPDSMRRDSAKGGKSRKDITGSLASRTSAGGGLGTDFDINGGLIANAVKASPQGHRHDPSADTYIISTGNTSHCLNAGGMGRQDYETETMVVGTLRSDHSNSANSEHCIAFSGRNRGDDGRGYDRPPNVTGEVAGAVDTVKPGNVAGPSIGVRRLTPLECERLMGLPDLWTLVPHRGKMAADGPRYKAIGNSMAVPCMRWIGQRIMEQEATCHPAS